MFPLEITIEQFHWATLGITHCKTIWLNMTTSTWLLQFQVSLNRWVVKIQNIFNSLTIPSSFKKLYSTCRHWSVSQPISVHMHRRRNLGGVTLGACAPPKFHKLSCSMCSFKLCPPFRQSKSLSYTYDMHPSARYYLVHVGDNQLAITYMVPAAADGCI